MCRFGLLLFLILSPVTFGHGGVVEEDDLCVIKIGYLRAHFKIYVPAERQHQEYCEDIPVRGDSVFVMEYQHDEHAVASTREIAPERTGCGPGQRAKCVPHQFSHTKLPSTKSRELRPMHREWAFH